MISVIIPACNEERLIARCLDALVSGAEPGELEIIVVANGCSDATAEVAGRYPPAVRVAELATGSKPLALNLGDEMAAAFPRIYLDADVTIDIGAVRRLAGAVQGGDAHFAAPRVQLDLDGCSWPVRAYYEIWGRLPYVRHNMGGTGVYVLSQEGRSRFDRFPPLIADDLFIRDLFGADERAAVDGCHVIVKPPLDLISLIRVKSRVFAGNRQYHRRYPGISRLAPSSTDRTERPFREILAHPRLWPAAATYIAIYVIAQARGWWKFRFGDLSHWERDETGRSTEGAVRLAK